MEYREKFSPWMSEMKEETGICHSWVELTEYSVIPYYGPVYRCERCGELSKGWNLWKEDFLPTCPNDRAWK